MCAINLVLIFQTFYFPLNYPTVIIIVVVIIINYSTIIIIVVLPTMIILVLVVVRFESERKPPEILKPEIQPSTGKQPRNVMPSEW